MRHLLTVGLVLAVVAPLAAQTEVQHLPYGPDPQYAGDPNQPDITWCLGWSGYNGRSKPTLMGWTEASCGVAAAVFDKTELQAAIDDAVAMYGTWEAQILVTQVNWITTPIPLQFAPVVGSAGVGSSDGLFAYQADGSNDHPILQDAAFNKTHRLAPQGSWTDDLGTVQARFEDAVVSGLGRGASALNLGPTWTQEYGWPDTHPAWNIVINATDIVGHYVDSDALLLFAGARGDIGITVFGANQWGGDADIRVRITPEPVSLALLAMGGLVALRRRR
jgi:hypothetical protein